MAARRAKKTKRRVDLVAGIVAALTDPEIRGTIAIYKSEDYIKQFMYRYLVDELTSRHRSLSPTLSEAKLRRKAQRSVVWEGDVKASIKNMKFLGASHRPDFEVLLPWAKIAVEIKRGSSGQQVRDGLGQCLVYAQKYEFVVFVMIDSSKSAKIKRSVKSDPESRFLKSLWDNYNIKFAVM